MKKESAHRQTLLRLGLILLVASLFYFPPIWTRDLWKLRSGPPHWCHWPSAGELRRVIAIAVVTYRTETPRGVRSETIELNNEKPEAIVQALFSSGFWILSSVFYFFSPE